jgi:hypothetical protein
MMACTIAKNLGIPGFTDLGDFAKGELDLTFKPRAVIPLTDVEESALLQAKATAYQTMTSAGLSDVFALRTVYDLTDEQIAEEIDRATADAEIAIERQAQAFGDQGQPPAQQQGVQQ